MIVNSTEFATEICVNVEKLTPALLTKTLAIPITRNGLPYNSPFIYPFFVKPAVSSNPPNLISSIQHKTMQESAHNLSNPMTGLSSHENKEDIDNNTKEITIENITTYLFAIFFII